MYNLNRRLPGQKAQPDIPVVLCPGAEGGGLAFDAVPFDKLKAVRLPGALSMTGDKRSHFYARLNPNSPAYDPTFPRPFRLSQSARGPTVWWQHEIIGWLQARAATRVAA